MTRVRLPLNSLAAWNRYATETIYQHHGLQTYARPYEEPPYSRTPTQDAVRLLNVQLTTAWTYLSAQDKATWRAAAARRHETSQNSFYRVNFRRLRCGQTMAATYPPGP